MLLNAAPANGRTSSQISNNRTDTKWKRFKIGPLENKTVCNNIRVYIIFYEDLLRLNLIFQIRKQKRKHKKYISSYWSVISLV